MEKATLGGGCFWCLEAVFREMVGVTSVQSGYAGGHVLNPTYEEVCGKRTGHAEVVQITYGALAAPNCNRNRTIDRFLACGAGA